MKLRMSVKYKWGRSFRNRNDHGLQIQGFMAEMDKQWVKARNDDQMAELFVTDMGVGVAKEDLPPSRRFWFSWDRSGVGHQ